MNCIQEPPAVQSIPAQPIEPIKSNQAVSISAPFAAVRDFLVNLPAPRRPKRNRPLCHEDAQDVAANVDARKSGAKAPIDELWKELGL